MTEQATKVALSPFELELVSNVDWIHAKNSILLKTAEIMGDVANHLQSAYRQPNQCMPAWLKQSPKISRGEVYEELPWLMLDYPREFQREDWLAIRHFFSWGRGFTVSLLLRGKYVDRALDCWKSHWMLWRELGFTQVVIDDPWKHRADPAYETSLAALSFEKAEEIVRQHGFIQIRKHLPVQNWAGAYAFMMETHQVFIPLIREITQGD